MGVVSLPKSGQTMGAGRAGRGRYAQDAVPTSGQLLQRHRLRAGLTQEELAARAGYSANYIGKLEQDLRELPAAAADRLAAVLGLTGQDLAVLRAARGRWRGGALAGGVVCPRGAGPPGTRIWPGSAVFWPVPGHRCCCWPASWAWARPGCWRRPRRPRP